MFNVYVLIYTGGKMLEDEIPPKQDIFNYFRYFQGPTVHLPEDTAPFFWAHQALLLCRIGGASCHAVFITQGFADGGDIRTGRDRGVLVRRQDHHL